MGGHMGADVFLTQAEVAELTGISRGKRIGGHLLNREQLQVQWLRTSGIPFFENARGRPIIARAVIEGRPAAPREEQKRGWQPRVLAGG
nr:DUF4224 domain-containing protein [Alcaligenes faecalis]